MAALTATFLGYAALAASLAGTAVSAYGANEQRKTVEATSAYNAKLQENEALQADMESRENERRTRERNRSFLASNRASLAASGVTESGSPLEDLAYNAGKLELSVQDEARSAQSRLQLGFNQAAQTRAAGAAQGQAIGIGMAGTILSGLGSAAGSYGNLKYIGAIKK